MDPGPSPDRSIPRIGSPLPYRQTRYSRRPAPARQQRRGFCPDRTPAATGAACTRAHGFEGRRPDYNRGCPGCARPPSFAHRYHRSHGMRGGRLVWGGPPEGLIGAALEGDAESAGATADPATAPPGLGLGIDAARPSWRRIPGIFTGPPKAASLGLKCGLFVGASCRLPKRFYTARVTWAVSSVGRAADS